ncbi:MAG TPA: hypothetical protein VGN72_10575 [Tepidisphaeraceae bacterium]|jgi:hypothetical protein|nr:hypothetical protein [Tepidisphaeraceae bacterium]
METLQADVPTAVWVGKTRIRAPLCTILHHRVVAMTVALTRALSYSVIKETLSISTPALRD